MEYFFTIYLIGSVACFSIIILRLILAYLFSRMNGGHIFDKNLEKLSLFRWSTGEVKEAKESLGRVIFVGAIDTATSWVGFLILSVKLIIFIGTSIRRIFEKMPDNLATLSFPLSRTLALTPENVWARLFAMEALVSAAKPSVLSIENNLRETKDRVGGFNCSLALECLESLNVPGIESDDLVHLKVVLSDDNWDTDPL